MKKSVLALILSCLFLYNCKSEKKETSIEPEKESSILEKIALANGYEHWKDIDELRFTFNVDRDTAHFERKWVWRPTENTVTGISLGDTVTYSRSAIDSTLFKVDAAFINDKYWLLAPFNLIWDQYNFSYEHSASVEAPMSKSAMQKLTIVYASEGGYTPGDAYDFYFGDDYLIKEWVFRKANQEDPSMITSWEEYVDISGLKLSKMHKKQGENFTLHFTGIEATSTR